MSAVLRVAALLALVALAASACGSDNGVPGDQALKPAKAPSGWTRTTLPGVSVAVPSTWTKGQPQKATATMTVTTWRAAEVDGKVPAGLEVRVITHPQQNARKAARALGLSAMSTLHAGQVEPDQVTWPHAESAYYLHYTATSTTSSTSYVTRTLVLDLADGSQVQVTAIAEKGQDTGLPAKVLSTVEVDDSRAS